MATEVTEITAAAIGWKRWTREIWRHRQVLLWLARSDFQARYKRASFGILWAVLMPLIQGAVLTLVFSRLISTNGRTFPIFVLSGIFAWNFFSQVLPASSTAVVEGASLSEKIWFPRLILPLVSVIAQVPAFLVSLLILVALTLVPFFDSELGPNLLLLVPATFSIVALTSGLGLILSALHVYFRDVRFLVQAALLLLFWVTPVVYPPSLLGDLEFLTTLNPVTGVLNLFRMATLASPPDPVALMITGIFIVGLFAVGLAVHRHFDRLFVDLL